MPWRSNLLLGQLVNWLQDRAAPSSLPLLRSPAHRVTFWLELSHSVAHLGSNEFFVVDTLTLAVYDMCAVYQDRLHFRNFAASGQ